MTSTSQVRRKNAFAKMQRRVSRQDGAAGCGRGLVNAVVQLQNDMIRKHRLVSQGGETRTDALFFVARRYRNYGSNLREKMF